MAKLTEDEEKLIKNNIREKESALKKLVDLKNLNEEQQKQKQLLEAEIEHLKLQLASASAPEGAPHDDSTQENGKSTYKLSADQSNMDPILRAYLNLYPNRKIDRHPEDNSPVLEFSTPEEANQFFQAQSDAGHSFLAGKLDKDNKLIDDFKLSCGKGLYFKGSIAELRAHLDKQDKNDPKIQKGYSYLAKAQAMLNRQNTAQSPVLQSPEDQEEPNRENNMGM